MFQYEAPKNTHFLVENLTLNEENVMTMTML